MTANTEANEFNVLQSAFAALSLCGLVTIVLLVYTYRKIGTQTERYLVALLAGYTLFAVRTVTL